MDELPSPLLKSRIPRKTSLFTRNEQSQIYNLHCPLRKGIICYHQDGAIFEYNIHSSGKHEPRIIVPKHASRELETILFIPIKGNRILLFARYIKFGNTTFKPFTLHLSIHEIRSDYRVGPALWSFNGSVDGHNFDIDDLVPIKSTENALGITFGVQFDHHWELFDIPTTDTDVSDNFPLIESGRIDFDLKFKLKWRDDPVILSPDGNILLNTDVESDRRNETIDIHYLDSGGTNLNVNFSFVSRMSIPFPRDPRQYPNLQAPILAFSADGSKFSMAMARSRVSVWDIRNKVPLKTFMEVPKSDYHTQPVKYLQFSSGKQGKEALVFVERDNLSSLDIIHVIDATSFETEEILPLNLVENTAEYGGVGVLFFDPSGGTLYAELYGTLYEWDLRKNEPGHEWWIGEE